MRCESFWGKGIATAALRATTEWAFVAGYQREALLRHSILKDGVLGDQYLYAIVR